LSAMLRVLPFARECGGAWQWTRRYLANNSATANMSAWGRHYRGKQWTTVSCLTARLCLRLAARSGHQRMAATACGWQRPPFCVSCNDCITDQQCWAGLLLWPLERLSSLLLVENNASQVSLRYQFGDAVCVKRAAY
jgi:hypothetical protein